MEENVSKSNKSERMSTLEKLKSSFRSIKVGVDIMDASDNMDRLQAIKSKMGSFEPAFKKLESEMLDDQAESVEWEMFAEAMSQYSALADAVAEKLIVRKESDEVVSEAVSDEDLILTLKHVEDVLGTAKDESEFEGMKEALSLVSHEVERMEIGEVKEKFEEAVSIMMEKLNEKRMTAKSENAVAEKLIVRKESDEVASEAVSDEDLILTLKHVKDVMGTAKDETEFEGIKEALSLVSHEVEKMEIGEVKEKFEEAVSVMMEKLSEKRMTAKSEHCETESENGSFPCCVGLSGDLCVAYIVKIVPTLEGKCYVLKPGMFTIQNVDYDRVWVRVNDAGIVEEAPMRG